MEYINTFNTTAEYNAAKSGEAYGRPHVSLVLDNDEIHYEGDNRLVAKFNVTNTNNVKICEKTSGFSKIEIDGVEMSPIASGYTFGTTGEHIVKYTLANETTIVQDAFRGCPMLTSIQIPNNVTTINHGAFSNCSGLTSIHIGANVSSMVGSIASSNSNITSITVDNGNSVYDSRNNCNAIIETATNKLIQGCPNTIIPNDIVVIANDAFGDQGIETINIPEGVTTIEQEAFIGNNLTSLTIPSTVTSIGVMAFSYGMLTSITCFAITPPTLSSNSFSNNNNLAHIYVPNESVNIYKSQSSGGNWYDYRSIIEGLPVG